MFHGVCHCMLLYAVFSRLSDIEKIKDEIADYKIKTATLRFNGFDISREVTVKEILREGGIIITPQRKKLWSM